MPISILVKDKICASCNALSLRVNTSLDTNGIESLQLSIVLKLFKTFLYDRFSFS